MSHLRAAYLIKLVPLKPVLENIELAKEKKIPFFII